MSKLSMPDTLTHTDTRLHTPSKSTEISESESDSFDSEPNTPKRQSLCSVRSDGAAENTSESTTDETVQANGQEHQDLVSAEHQEEEETKSSAAAPSEDTHDASTDGDDQTKLLSADEDKAAPVPTPRRSSTSKKNEGGMDENTKGSSEDAKDQKTEYENPPGFLYKVECL